MKLQLTCALVLISFVVFQKNTAAADKDVIEWGVMQWAPWQYKENGEAKGYSVEWIKMLQKELPEYTHKYLFANKKRLTATLAGTSHACMNGGILAEDTNFLPRTSLPDMIYYTQNLIMLNETHKKLGSPASLSLRDLLKNKKGMLGITAGVGHGALSSIIEKYEKDTKRIYVRTGSDITIGLMKMLKEKRIQFTMDYPPEAIYNAEKVGLNDVVFVVIDEQVKFSQSYTMCSNSAWGKAVVGKIDKILKKLALQPEWQSHYLQYLNENSAKPWKEEMARVYSQGQENHRIRPMVVERHKLQ